QARAQMLRQAELVSGARPIAPSVGTAPGQVIATGTSTLVLLPGPPAEMRPMVREFLGSGHHAAHVRTLRCLGITETDAQLAAQAVLGNSPGIGLTVLATPALVDVVLFDEGADDPALDEAATRIAAALGTACYSTDGSTLAETVLAHARSTGDRLATAESCTGGMVASALTDVPGASDVFAGGVVAYSNDVKTSLLGVPPSTLAAHGAVSEETALAMATGALGLGATCAVATTGVAGPTGGSPDKPVGLVWIATASRHSQGTAREYRFPGDRAGVRARATAHALDALRRALLVP
ncbi:MAG: nicotinamide-nucleotide amidohydrolase family protein, partial [Coriobacteriales bacterium]